MGIYFKEGATAKAYVVTSSLEMVTAEIPVVNDTDQPVLFSVYCAAFDPDEECVTTTETLFRLGAGADCVITDELIRIKEPKNDGEGYTVRCTLLVNGEVQDKQTLPVEIVD